MSYQTYFQEAKAAYDRIDQFDVDTSIATLDDMLARYSKDPSDGNRTALQNAFTPIADYYSKLTDVTMNLQTFLNKASKSVADGQSRLASEERYINKVYPEESVNAREVTTLFPPLRIGSIPILLGIGVILLILTGFILFHVTGFSVQVGAPPALLAWWASDMVLFYRDPTILTGTIVALCIVVIALSLRK